MSVCHSCVSLWRLLYVSDQVWKRHVMFGELSQECHPERQRLICSSLRVYKMLHLPKVGCDAGQKNGSKRKVLNRALAVKSSRKELKLSHPPCLSPQGDNSNEPCAGLDCSRGCRCNPEKGARVSLPHGIVWFGLFSCNDFFLLGSSPFFFFLHPTSLTIQHWKARLAPYCTPLLLNNIETPIHWRLNDMAPVANFPLTVIVRQQEGS